MPEKIDIARRLLPPPSRLKTVDCTVTVNQMYTLGVDDVGGEGYPTVTGVRGIEKSLTIAYEGEPVLIQAVFRQVNVANGLR